MHGSRLNAVAMATMGTVASLHIQKCSLGISLHVYNFGAFINGLVCKVAHLAMHG